MGFKIIDERLSQEYKGMIRTISLSDRNEIIVEYNIVFSNEIGHQFKKLFLNYQSVAEFVGKFINIKQEKVSETDDYELEKMGIDSNIKMIKDILDGNLPDLLDGFIYLGNKKDLKDLYHLILSLDN